MPIGKDSIKTRVAKVATSDEVAAPGIFDTPTEPKAPAKKPAAKTAAAKTAAAKTTAAKTAVKKAEPKTGDAAPAKKPAAKKTSPKAEAPKAAEPITTVLSGVAPETVAAVIGHDEKKPSDKVKIGQRLPTHLL